jgi:AcrR family transcriptional regulator
MSVRKDQIRVQAQTLFRERGYAATSMRDIAESLGIEAASLYNHIHSKEQILQEICFRMAEHFFAAIEPISKSSVVPVEKLRLVIEAHLAVIAAHNDASAVFLHEWRHLGEPYLSDFKLMRNRYEKIFRSLIEDGMKSGDFRDMNVALTVRTMLSAMNWTYESYSGKRKIDPAETASHIGTMMLNGILK